MKRTILALSFASALLAQRPLPSPVVAGGGGGGGTPASPVNSVQYNNAGAFGGSDILSYDGTNRRNVMTRAGIEFDPIENPTVPVATLITTGTGNIQNGTHLYCVSFGDALSRETGCSLPSNIVTVDASHKQISLALQACPTGAINWRIYRTSSNNSSAGGLGLLNTYPCASANPFIDNQSDAALTTAPQINTTGGYTYCGVVPCFYLSTDAIRFGPPVLLDANRDFLVAGQNMKNPGFADYYDPGAFIFTNSYEADSFSTHDDAYSLQGFFNSFGTGNFNSLNGILSDNGIRNVGTLDLSVSIQATTNLANTAVREADDFLSYSGFGDGGSILDFSHFRAYSAYNGTSTITNEYGLKVDSVAVGVNKWAIKTGLGKVEFGDVVQSDGVVFASLPGTPVNGMQIFCSDCTVTSGIDNTCAASGSGAFANRVNGVWRCQI